MSWTDERVARLSKLWADGLSASQVAADLGGVTRNAVIGKVPGISTWTGSTTGINQGQCVTGSGTFKGVSLAGKTLCCPEGLCPVVVRVCACSLLGGCVHMRMCVWFVRAPL